MEIHIETDRLIMRDIEYSDAEGMFKLDSSSEVHRYLHDDPIKTIDEAINIITYIRNQYKTNGIGRWAVIDKESGDFMGWSGLKIEDEVRPGQKYYDIGYRLRPEFWGRGIATETAIESLRYGFEVMKLPEICGAAVFENGASNRILEKIGMQLTETFICDGMDCNWYRITGDRWTQLYP